MGAFLAPSTQLGVDVVGGVEEGDQDETGGVGIAGVTGGFE